MQVRRIVGVGAVSVLLAGAAWVGVATATASGTSAGNATSSGGGTLRFVASEVEVAEIDLGEAGFSQGDQTVFADDLLRGGDKIGTDGGVCTLVRVSGDPEYSCEITYRLPRGAITGHTLLRASELPVVRFAITGGTGAFNEVDGEGRSLLQDTAPVVLHLED